MILFKQNIIKFNLNEKLMFLLLMQSRDISIPLKLNLKKVLVTLNLKSNERGKDNQLACQL